MSKQFYRAAKRVHRYQYPNLDQEEISFCDFKYELRRAGNIHQKLFESKQFLITSNGQWFTPPIRFTGKDDKGGHYNDSNSSFWRGKDTTTLKRAKPLILNYARHHGCHKPLVVILSQRVFRREVNHTTCLILCRNKLGKLQAILKDSNKIKRCTANRFAREICESLNIRQLLVVGRLPGQRKPTEGSCLKEAFKIVGRVLDGNYPLSLFTADSSFKFTYDIKRRRKTES